jgi:hypothetical protein
VTERHLIAYAILILFLLGLVAMWCRKRRIRREPDAHLRIDLIEGHSEN